ncbi:hypothetical protein BO70DRAFT_429190 [Aspergillus heteromorphus CBS 117.55]|uniref:Glycine zipper 2TM domain-containing protein n=1 Tax=Aspergillus heteromorphus CBS 117.55 TaxID=1448321 RepID=A0A317W8R5_9EURO|nr:uncharacterized protein BO70DRAFT_429190 [Aspergillus heteromorphus CBS 117.55]PWY82121.1 hypothetical protein BO70DRAFT_429190 [Aspergillus heteromorphus CBS 117.55]
MSQYNNEQYSQQGYPPYNEHYTQNHYPAGPGYAPPQSMPQERGQSPYPPQQSYERVGENASYYGEPLPQQEYAPGQNGPTEDGEKGLGSTVIGGAAGGYAAHHAGSGALGTAGGAVLGAVGMNMATSAWKKHNAPAPVAAPATAVPVTVVPASTVADTGMGLGMGMGLLGARTHFGRRRLLRHSIGLP